MSGKNTLVGMPDPPDIATPGRKIPKGFDMQSKQYDPYCNQVQSVSGAGSTFPIALDEQTSLSNMVLSIDCVYAEDLQSIDGQNGQERI